MTRSTLRLTVALACLFATGVLHAQAPRERSAQQVLEVLPPITQVSASDSTLPGLPPIFMNVKASSPMPAARDGWVLHVITRGGLGGGGLGDVTIDSARAMTCTAAETKCPSRLAADRFQPLAEVVQRASALAWTGALSYCSDCMATLVVLRRRQPDNSEAISTAFWDITTQGNVAADVKRMYSMAMALRQQ